MVIHLHLDPPTTTYQQKKVAFNGGRPFVYESDNLKRTRQLYMTMLGNRRPSEPMRGALRVSVDWRFKSNDAKRHADGSWRTSRPDIDNLNKLLLDCMTRSAFWIDDSQIVQLECSKSWSVDNPGITIVIEEV